MKKQNTLLIIIVILLIALLVSQYFLYQKIENIEMNIRAYFQDLK